MSEEQTGINKERVYKIEHVPIELRTDGAGLMRITAHTDRGKYALMKHFRIYDDDPVQMAEVIQDPGDYVVVRGAVNERDNGGYFRRSGSIGGDYIRPYVDAARIRMGINRLPDIPSEYLTPRDRWNGLHHTFYLLEFKVQDNDLHYDVLVHTSDWNGRTAEKRADWRALEVVQDEFGSTKSNPEFIDAGNGLLKRNPAYPGEPIRSPAFERQWFWTAIVDYWLAHHATPGQLACHEHNATVVNPKARLQGDLYSMVYGAGSAGIRKSWEADGLISWDEFINLK